MTLEIITLLAEQLGTIHVICSKPLPIRQCLRPPCLVTFSSACAYICVLGVGLYLGIACCAEYSLRLCKGLENRVSKNLATICAGFTEQKTPT